MPPIGINVPLRRLGALGEEEERVRSEIAGLSPELLRLYREGTKVEGPLGPLEIYRDSGQIAALAHRLAAEATDELRACFRDPSALSSPENRRLFKEALGRGVRCRVLVDSGASFARELGGLGAGFFGQGLEVRSLAGRAQLPARMLIVDGSTGLIILRDPQGYTYPDSRRQSG